MPVACYAMTVCILSTNIVLLCEPDKYQLIGNLSVVLVYVACLAAV